MHHALLLEILLVLSQHDHVARSTTAMEDTTMLDGSQGLFEELSFTIYQNGLSEDRLREVRDASQFDIHVTDALLRLNSQ